MHKRTRQQTERRLRIASLKTALRLIDHPLGAKDLADLTSKVYGTVLLPTDPTYDHLRQLTNQAFQDFPQAIVYCAVINDVRECLKFAQDHKLWVVARSGGHSTAGYSVNSGLLIDMSKFCYATVDVKNKRVVVGAGTPFGYLNRVLHEYGLHVPTGACPDVCVAGYMQGGGYGFTSREFGMNCDNVESAQLMLADGRVVTASATQNPDLFWAIRGGTGGNFGILLEVTYRLYEVGKLWGLWLRWPIEQAAAVLAELQKNYMKTGAPAKLGYQAQVCYQSDKNGPENESPKGYIVIRGMFNGTEADGMKVLGSLLAIPKAEIQHQAYGSYLDLNDTLCEIPNDIPEVPDLAREDKQSVYIPKQLTKTQWQLIIDAFQKTPNQYSMIAIEAYGGAINKVAPDASAFMHRDVDMDLFLDVFWMSDEERKTVNRFLDEFIEVVRPFSDGHSYQNYPRRTMKNYRWEFFGKNFNTLLAIKKKYDPENFFHYQQSIKAVDESEGPGVLKDDSPVIPHIEKFIKQPIQ